MKFSDLQLSSPILEAIKSEGYTTATPIQAMAIPHVLAGRDVLGSAQTGTGKTAAFAMPILQRLSTKPATGAKRARCLVLSPTRELAVQIADSFKAYGKALHLRHVTIFGGVGQYPQVDALRRGVDIIIATPGRLMDLMEQRHVDLTGIEVLVLDEADRMLDMGFIQPIRRIVAKLPAGRQTLLFSATMPPEIRRLADSLLRDPAVVEVTPVAATTAQIEESVYRVARHDKADLLAHLVGSLPMYRTIVFTRTKHGADKVVRHLHKRGIKAEAIHGNKSQNNRQRALSNFSANKIPVLVATDIASRGIDVEGITHVVNYDLTHEPETYVHRIGRTGRAGAMGAAVSFVDRDEASNLRAIERLIRRSIPVLVNPLPPTDPAVRAAEAREERHHADGGRRPTREPRERQSYDQQPSQPRAAHPKTAHTGTAHTTTAQPRAAHPIHAGRSSGQHRSGHPREERAGQQSRPAAAATPATVPGRGAKPVPSNNARPRHPFGGQNAAAVPARQRKQHRKGPSRFEGAGNRRP